MLILSRKIQEVIRINDDIAIKIIGINGQQVRIGIEAPKNVGVHREEIYNKIKLEADLKLEDVTE